MLSIPQRSINIAALLAAACLASISPLVALAQDSDHHWQKEYTLSGKPTLSLDTGDSNVEIHSCGNCKSIRIRVETSSNLDKYHLEERQEQDHVYFSFKDKIRVSFNLHLKPTPAPKVTIETPSQLDLDAHSSDGSLSAMQLTGSLQVHSSDGAVTLDDVHGDLRLSSSDGDISLHNASGSLEARSSDGSMKLDGQFSSVQLHTSDGHLDFALKPGSQLTSASRIESSDGRVSIRLPQTLSADLDVSTGDGKLDCTLPLTMDHYSTKGSGAHHLHGHLNAGGTPITIHTSDGSVSITAL